MYPQSDPCYVRVGIPDELMLGFERRLNKLDSEWKKKVYSLKSSSVSITGKKPYSYTVLSVPMHLEQKLSWLFRLRRWLWAAVHNTEFL